MSNEHYIMPNYKGNEILLKNYFHVFFCRLWWNFCS